MSSRRVYVPRPIALVSTRSPDGVGNLAPFTYCPLLCTSAATVSHQERVPYEPVD